MKRIHAFTLVELMVVILIVSILSAVSVPLMRGRIDAAKWAEANATAGVIRSAVRAHFAENGSVEGMTGSLGEAALRTALGFYESDLTGTYFVPGDYAITDVNANGVATVRVTGSQTNAPSGSMTLDADGVWRSSSAETGGGSAPGGNDNTGGSGGNSGDNGNNGNDSGNTPGNSGNTPGNSGNAPGNSGNAPWWRWW